MGALDPSAFGPVIIEQITIEPNIRTAAFFLIVALAVLVPVALHETFKNGRGKRR
jgi:hypothetical protein